MLSPVERRTNSRPSRLGSAERALHQRTHVAAKQGEGAFQQLDRQEAEERAQGVEIGHAQLFVQPQDFGRAALGAAGDDHFAVEDLGIEIPLGQHALAIEESEALEPGGEFQQGRPEFRARAFVGLADIDEAAERHASRIAARVRRR